MRKAADFTCLYLDFDSYFASAEQHLRPELRGRPVGIIPLESRYTSLIAASREAKRFGLKTGTAVLEALEKCPGIVLVRARHEEYVRLHHTIIGIVDSIAPVKKVCSIDELACSLLANERARAIGIAEDIKRKLARDIGPTLTCSIGLGPNELLAKIAAEMRKPDGLVALRQDELPGPLLDLKLTDVPGIARRNAARLAAANVTTIAELWDLAPGQMRAIWGGLQGERLWAFLHGFDIEHASTRRGMFSHSRVLAWDWRGPAETEACARLLLVKAMRRMRREGFAATALTLGLKPQHGPGWETEQRRGPFRDDRTALVILTELFRRARASGLPERTRKVSVVLHGLVDAARARDDLLEDACARRNRERWEHLADLTDAVVDRYQSAVLTLGPRVTLPGGYAGAKIAFNRIPDLADF
ncbi:MAG: type VI secretion protein ImpB [Hyphomicrobium sp.]|nr:type VI secretion protein ImpB [Hyphomicrobium sp.]